jgi:uncharacterized protein DUF5691
MTLDPAASAGGPGPGSDVPFDQLVTAATVGVSRKPPPLPGDPATALLDAAAVATVARRAGYQPPRDVAPPAAPAETEPTFSARAARALRATCGWRAGRFDVDSPLLPDLLGAAAGAGYVAYPLLLPALLDAAVSRTALRGPVAAVLGARGRWLAGHRPDWRQVAEQSAADGSGDPETWRTGGPAQRRAYLARLRGADPDAARDLLAEGWATETGADRAALIAVLNDGLSLADEEFLEAALDDRASAVRLEARRMLARLPGSAFARRARRRADGVLRVERRGARSGVVATPPGTPDAAALRDGLNVSPPAPSIGTRAWQLTQVVAAAALADWTERFGRTPAEIVTLPVADGARADVHAGWRLAAVDQANAEWARALLAASDPGAGGGASGGRDAGRGRPAAAWPPDSALAALLPPEERAARAAAALADMRLTSGVNPPGWTAPRAPLPDGVGDWPGPWPEVLADAVLATLERAGGLPVLPPAARLLLAAAARGLPAAGQRDYAAVLSRMAEACPQAWAPALREAAETVAFRRVFLAEIGRA